MRESEDVGSEVQKPVSKSLTLGDVVTLRERNRGK